MPIVFEILATRMYHIHSRPLSTRWTASPVGCSPNRPAEVARRRCKCHAITVQPALTLSELRSVARLRAEAYYEDNSSRFVESLKKKFVGQEVESLQLRTGPTSGSGAPQVECLVATLEATDDDSNTVHDDIDNDGEENEEDESSFGGSGSSSSGGSSSSTLGASSSRVVGCIDIKLSKATCGIFPAGVPHDDLQGCYLLNVVVDESLRGQGIGKELMNAAMKRAVHVWKSGAMYTHVEADNEAAFRLYKACGFSEFSVDDKYGSTLKLGRLVLLRAGPDTVPAL